MDPSMYLKGHLLYFSQHFWVFHSRAFSLCSLSHCCKQKPLPSLLKDSLYLYFQACFVWVLELVFVVVVCFTATYLWDFARSLVVKSPPCSGGDTNLIPGQGLEMPHALEQPLSLHTPEPGATAKVKDLTCCSSDPTQPDKSVCDLKMRIYLFGCVGS